MSGKDLKSYVRSSQPDSRLPSFTITDLQFGHESIGNETFISWGSLNWPSQAQIDYGFQNPNPSTILAANMYNYSPNFRMASTRNPKWLSNMYTLSSSGITLKIPTLAGEQFVFTFVNNPRNGIGLLDSKPIYVPSLLASGLTEFDFFDPVLIDKTSQQTHPIVVFRNDILCYPNSLNNPAGTDGDYYLKEIGNSGYARSIIFLNAAPTGGDRILVHSVGIPCNRPTMGMQAEVETLAGAVDRLITDVALMAGNPTSDYRTTPSNVDLAYFGQMMAKLIAAFQMDSAQVTGLLFPLTQVPNSNPNVLDDYEEGVWTPNVASSGGTLTTLTALSGVYTKVGNFVTLRMNIGITTNGTGSGEILVSNLPFTVAAGSYVIGWGRETAATGVMLQAYAAPLSNLAHVVKYDNTYPGNNGYNLVIHMTYNCI